MRLPNGYGSVTKMSGIRRKPWRVRVTLGWNDDGTRITKNIGYYTTRKEAFNALNEYKMEPDSYSNLTVIQAIEMWKKENFEKLAIKTQNAYNAAIKILTPLHEKEANKLKLADYYSFIELYSVKSSMIHHIKNVLTNAYKQALKHELVTEDTIKIVNYIDKNKGIKPVSKERTIFSKEEIDLLWKEKEYPALILLSTGMRIGEYLSLTEDCIHGTYVEIKKSKTKSGIRTVPIIEPLQPHIKPLEYKNYVAFVTKYWNPLMKRLNMKHRVHDTRHTFTSIATEGGMDIRILKSILGHAYKDITGLYTHISPEQKLKATYEHCATLATRAQKFPQSDTSKIAVYRS